MAALSSYTTWLLSGERAVVILFIALTLHILLPSLLSHGLSLSFLALSSFFLEIRYDYYASNDPSLLRTRPGASLGILLGTVTLPAVILSNLIQLSRGMSLAEVKIEELQYLTLQYWAASAGCLSVLFFLSLILRPAISSQSDWSLSCSMCFSFLQAAICCVSLSATYDSGLNPILKLSSVFFPGLAAVKLCQHLLSTFPFCASIGEVLLVTMGIVCYFGDMSLHTIAKSCRPLMSLEFVTSEYGISRSEINVIIQGLLLGLLLYPVAFKYIIKIWEWSISSASAEARRFNEIGRSLIFFASLGLVMVVLMPSWMQFAHEFQVHPFLWVLSFVFSEPFKRLSLYIYWPKFLDLAFGAALAVFLALEIIQVWRIWPLGQPIHQFMNAFTDHRDSDLLIVSHFSLLLGCALPIWMSSGYNDRPLAPFAGILSLGI